MSQSSATATSPSSPEVKLNGSIPTLPAQPDRPAADAIPPPAFPLPSRDPLIERLAGALSQIEAAQPSLSETLSQSGAARIASAPGRAITPRAVQPAPFVPYRGLPARAQLPALASSPLDFDDDDDEGPITLPTAWRNQLVPASATGARAQVRAGLVGFGAGLVLVIPLAVYLATRVEIEKPVDTVLLGSALSVPPVAAALPVPSAVLTPARAAVAARTDAAEPAPAAASASNAIAVLKVAPMMVASPTTDPPALPAAQTPAPPALAPQPVQIATPHVTLPSKAPAIPAALPAPAPSPHAGQLREAERLIAGGQIAEARDVLGRPAASGSAEAQFQLAETFDPNMLAVWGARGVRADAATARAFYTMALEAGITRARQRIEALN